MTKLRIGCRDQNNGRWHPAGEEVKIITKFVRSKEFDERPMVSLKFMDGGRVALGIEDIIDEPTISQKPNT